MSRGRLLASLIIGVLMVLLLGFALAAHSDLGRAQAQQGPTLQLASAGLTPQRVTAAVIAQGMANLGGFEFDLAADPAVARLTGAQAAGFLASSGRTVGALGPILGSQGENLAFGAYSYDPSGQNGPGPSGQGTLAVITLTVAGDGVSPLALANPLLVDVEANPQAVTAADAHPDQHAHGDGDRNADASDNRHVDAHTHAGALHHRGPRVSGSGSRWPLSGWRVGDHRIARHAGSCNPSGFPAPGGTNCHH